MQSVYSPMAMVRTGPVYKIVEGAGWTLMVGISVPLWRGKLRAGVSEAEAAIREGRGIFDNIRKALVYLLSGNAGELAIMLVASVVGLPLSLLPLQLRWVNLVADGLPGLALVMDPTSDDVMKQPRRGAAESSLSRSEWLTILIAGALQTASVVARQAHSSRTPACTARGVQRRNAPDSAQNGAVTLMILLSRGAFI